MEAFSVTSQGDATNALGQPTQLGGEVRFPSRSKSTAKTHYRHS
jgi:hypothetical protein